MPHCQYKNYLILFLFYSLFWFGFSSIFFFLVAQCIEWNNCSLKGKINEFDHFVQIQLEAWNRSRDTAKHHKKKNKQNTQIPLSQPERTRRLQTTTTKTKSVRENSDCSCKTKIYINKSIKSIISRSVYVFTTDSIIFIYECQISL